MSRPRPIATVSWMSTTADGAILGAAIRTLDASRPTAAAAALKDGMLIAVGSDNEVRAVIGDPTEVVDGHGLHVVPVPVGADLVTTNADELPDAPVAMTIVDGEILSRGADT
ncbi:MAG: amidohydrolase family protein [Solirubrobacterales bacterium]|nr:amidohydrolase family protein [Solirubrobacterales bacterium]